MSNFKKKISVFAALALIFSLRLPIPEMGFAP